jgi:hypothetical protein
MDEHTSHELAYQNGYAEGHEKGYKEGFLRGFDAGKQDAQKWIPVTERLPENDTYINVTTDGVVVQAYWHNGRFYAFTAIGVATVGGVTHWMPLTEPPKGE